MEKIGALHTLPRTSVVDREGYILNCCQGKSVLHLGCAAWPFTKELFESRRLLHEKLEKVCASLAGIDISEEGVSFLKSRGVKNLFITNVSKLEEIIQILGWTPKLMIAGEILEHVDAPGEFLRECVSHMPKDCQLLVTVPNAFSVKGFMRVMVGHEKVASDHLYYYLYVTML